MFAFICTTQLVVLRDCRSMCAYVTVSYWSRLCACMCLCSNFALFLSLRLYFTPVFLSVQLRLRKVFSFWFVHLVYSAGLHIAISVMHCLKNHMHLRFVRLTYFLRFPIFIRLYTYGVHFRSRSKTNIYTSNVLLNCFGVSYVSVYVVQWVCSKCVWNYS